MSTNTNRVRDAAVVMPFAVAAGTEAGDVIALGTAGLTGYCLTDRYVAADFTAETLASPPQGLADGEASVEVIGVSRVVSLTVAGGVSLGDLIYSDGAGGYDGTSTANAVIGYALEDIAAGEEGLVGLARA